MAPDNVPDVCPACGDPLCHGECPAADGAWVVGAAVCGVALACEFIGGADEAEANDCE
jgi:hypothetical protein